ncbi:MAG: hypothetical protein OXH01_02165 [Bacteroidetes bacterium]|nr:hypothetical protein [Bacteroidota bacterium]
MPSKTQSILIGGLIAAVTGTIVSVAAQVSGASDPTNPQQVLSLIFGLIGCMVMLTSGLVAVWHYATENELTLTGGQGVGIGALAGIVYAVVGLALGWLLILLGVLPSPQDTMDVMRDTGAFDAAGAEQAESITEMMITWGGPVMAVFGGVLMGLIGGAIGAALFKRGVESPDEGSTIM